MTQEQFDAHASIKRLAKWERLRKSLPDFEGDPPGSIGTQSMEVPFAALRVECLHPNSAWRDTAGLEAFCPDCGAVWYPWPGFLAAPKGFWVPEFDPEKADFRCLLVLARKDLARAQGVLADMAATGVKGLAIRAAEVWMEEKP